MPMHAGGWTAEREKVLRSMWGDGISAALIARSLGDGCTRNCVIGKVSRLKLAKRRTQVVVPPGGYRRGTPFSKTRQPQRRRAEIEPDSYVPPPSAWEPIPGTTPIGMMDLTDKTCRWPIGERPFLFCGCPPIQGSPYCVAHADRATTPIAPKSKRGVMKYHPGGDFRRLQPNVKTGANVYPFSSAAASNNGQPDLQDVPA